MNQTNSIENMAVLLLRASSEAAFQRLRAEARLQKQSIQEIAKRRASNVLRSMTLRIGA